jgi:hypothetical protein
VDKYFKYPFSICDTVLVTEKLLNFNSWASEMEQRAHIDELQYHHISILEAHVNFSKWIL